MHNSFKKLLLKSVVVIFSLNTMCLSTFSINVSSDYDNLEKIANDIVEIETFEDAEGKVYTTYTKLDELVLAIQKNFPEKSNYDISKFILTYTGQDYEGMPDNIILEYLKYDNITTSVQYVGPSTNTSATNSATPYASWTDPDGYMRISTNYSYIETIGGEAFYEVWAQAKWLIYPITGFTDAFAIGTTAVFNDDFPEEAYVNQKFYCDVCGRTNTRYRYVDVDSPRDGDLSLENDDFVPSIKFQPLAPPCDFCGVLTQEDTLFTVYLKYGVCATNSENIQASYGHGTIGFGDISVSIDTTGTPSFSSTLALIVDTFTARAVTISHSTSDT